MKQVPPTQNTSNEIQNWIDELELDDKLDLLRYMLKSLLGEGVKVVIDIDPADEAGKRKEITTPQLAQMLRKKAEELRSDQRGE